MFTAKVSSLREVNSRRLSHFASKSVGGSDLQRWAGKKSESHARLP